MFEQLGLKDALGTLSQSSVINALLMLALAIALAAAVQFLVPRVAQRFGGRTRLYILASVPLLRLIIIVTTAVLIVPVLIKPTVENMLAVFGALALALGFAFKDYANSLIAGVVTLYEMPYRPGDWIQIDDRYGEVKSIGTRAAKIVTPDDTVVVIPHSKLWDSLIANGNDGTDNLMCVADFHTSGDHDVARIRQRLRDMAFTSPLLKSHQPVVVVVAAKPWGIHYRVKGYPVDPREQFAFISDLTDRGMAVLREERVRLITAPVPGEQKLILRQ